MNMMGRYWFSRNASIGGLESRINIFNLGKNYFEVSGLTLLKGRSFDSTLISDIDNSILVNEKLVKEFSLESPIGEFLKIENGDSTETYQIIGVVNDFFHNGVSSKISPTILVYVAPELYRYAVIKYNTDKPSELIAKLESAWRKISPNLSLDWVYMDEMMAREARTNESIRLVFIYIAIMVVVISSMGLFALISLNITRRTKEMGIRKVLGASIANIGTLLCKDFVILLIVGSVLASAMAYFMVDALLSSIWTYYADYELSSFLLSTLMVFAVAILTIGYQIYSAAISNPVESIRDE